MLCHSYIYIFMLQKFYSMPNSSSGSKTIFAWKFQIKLFEIKKFLNHLINHSFPFSVKVKIKLYKDNLLASKCIEVNSYNKTNNITSILVNRSNCYDREKKKGEKNKQRVTVDVYLPPQAINWVGVQDCSMMEYVAEKQFCLLSR